MKVIRDVLAMRNPRFRCVDPSGEREVTIPVVHQTRVFYSNHNGGDDSIWGENIPDLIVRALRDPVDFLLHAGCYTRYFDGESDDQFIPEEFLHD